MISDKVINGIYEKIKTPYKYGKILKSDDYFLDSPVVFKNKSKWFMSCVCIDKKCSTGYTTHLFESDDLLCWTYVGQILKTNNGWDEKQTGGYAQFIDNDFDGDYEINKINGYYRFAYIGGNLHGYETDPLSVGYARTKEISDLDGYVKNEKPILSPDDNDARYGETLTVYKADMFIDEKSTLGHKYVCAYNAKNETNRESIFLAVSDDGENWKRYGENAIISVFDCDDSIKINGDPQITVIDGLYVMFYFIYDMKNKKAFNTFAVSENLVDWKKWEGKPLIESEYDYENVFAHKPWAVKKDGVVYHFYCAVNDKKERFIALATSKEIK
ncbi:MAG: hypothetical protein KBS59_06270 [Clostridiales bacterium]|nr:hypothetical protein [Clostridiales bacterium]